MDNSFYEKNETVQDTRYSDLAHTEDVARIVFADIDDEFEITSSSEN